MLRELLEALFEWRAKKLEEIRYKLWSANVKNNLKSQNSIITYPVLAYMELENVKIFEESGYDAAVEAALAYVDDIGKPRPPRTITYKDECGEM